MEVSIVKDKRNWIQRKTKSRAWIALSPDFHSLDLARGSAANGERWHESAAIPHEHWGFAMADETGAQFLRQGAVDDLQLVDE